jgi:hypothetical protein
MTHTYATLEVSQAAWGEILARLTECGHSFRLNHRGEIDMQGVALVKPERVGVPLTPTRRSPLRGASPDATGHW